MDNNQAIVGTVAVTVQVVVPAMQNGNGQGAQAGARDGPRGNGSDHFTKRLIDFYNISVLILSRDKGPMASFKGVVHA